MKRITVLAGLNSSGKSSVLQSILLLSQTMANQILDKPLVLNGSIVQLGTFEGVRNERADKNQIGIGFRLSFAEGHPRFHPERPLGRFYQGLQEVIREIEAHATFSGVMPSKDDSSAIEAVRVALTEAQFGAVTNLPPHPRGARAARVRNVSPEPYALPIKVLAQIKPLSEGQKANLLRHVREDYLRLLPYSDGGSYSATISYPGEPRNTSQVSPSQPYLTRLSHFLPNRFLARFDLEERRKQDVQSLIRSSLLEGGSHARYTLPPRSSSLAEQVFSLQPTRELVTSVSEKVPSGNKAELFDGESIQELIEWVRKVRWRGRPNLQAIETIEPAVSDFVVSQLQRGDAIVGAAGLEVVRDYATEIIDAAVEEVTGFFTGMVRYLGPLRADPQAAQGFAPSSEPDDVGSKGEYAAAVYDANKKRIIDWWHPKDQRRVESTLVEAMDTWVRYLGVAHQVATREAGLSGVSWMIRHIPESKERPLPAVGVGVSQVLPILVAGLLAPQGAVMLIEQPELHLHARAQARLGDFFVSLQQAGKQCIIETHSDCLVNQFRYHMVKGGDPIREAIAIYFVGQDEVGDSHFTSVDISDNGNIVNWPDGFFDEGLHQEDRITRAAVMARRSRTRDA